MKLILAGAASVYGLAELRSAFESFATETACGSREAADVLFAEAPFMKKYAPAEESEPVLYTESLPPDSCIVPLSEYWISYCARTQQCRISQRALLSSRSKKYLYELMASHGEDSVRVCQTLDEAYVLLQKTGYITVKPNGLMSGYGVQVLTREDAAKIALCAKEASAVQNNALRLMGIQNEGSLITEYLCGTEYSADVFFCRGRVSVVRVCRKFIQLIRGRPCTAVYQLIEMPSALIMEKLSAWCSILFDADNISFAQFDFIMTGSRIVPIDFACRIGGGLSDLMVQIGVNRYAAAVRGENLCDSCGVSDDGTSDSANVAHLSQFNYLPVENGYITNEQFPLLDGFQKIFKHTGSRVISNPSSVGSRVALVIRRCRTDEITPSVLESLLIDGRWISEKKPRARL